MSWIWTNPGLGNLFQGTVLISVSDSLTFTDTISSLAADLSLADNITNSDTLSILNDLSLQELLAFSDSETVLIKITVTDNVLCIETLLVITYSSAGTSVIISICE